MFRYLYMYIYTCMFTCMYTYIYSYYIYIYDIHIRGWTTCSGGVVSARRQLSCLLAVFELPELEIRATRWLPVLTECSCTPPCASEAAPAHATSQWKVVQGSYVRLVDLCITPP